VANYIKKIIKSLKDEQKKTAVGLGPHLFVKVLRPGDKAGKL